MAAEAAKRPTVEDLSGLTVETEISAEEAVARTIARRVPIDTPTLKGAINLDGAVIDDLSLKLYREELDPASAPVRILAPREAEHGQYIDQGFASFVNGEQASTQTLAWVAPEGARLTPATPVTLTASVGSLRFEKVFSIDERYMIDVKQKVTNVGVEPARIQPYGFVLQRNIPEDLVNLPVHQGPMFVADKQLAQRRYPKAAKTNFEATGAAGGAFCNTRRISASPMRSPTPDSCRPISDPSSARASAPSAGSRSPAIRKTSARPTRR